jgi:hypothetical protein
MFFTTASVDPVTHGRENLSVFGGYFAQVQMLELH